MGERSSKKEVTRIWGHPLAWSAVAKQVWTKRVHTLRRKKLKGRRASEGDGNWVVDWSGRERKGVEIQGNPTVEKGTMRGMGKGRDRNLILRTNKRIEEARRWRSKWWGGGGGPWRKVSLQWNNCDSFLWSLSTEGKGGRAEETPTCAWDRPTNHKRVRNPTHPPRRLSEREKG